MALGDPKARRRKLFVANMRRGGLSLSLDVDVPDCPTSPTNSLYSFLRFVIPISSI